MLTEIMHDWPGEIDPLFLGSSFSDTILKQDPMPIGFECFLKRDHQVIPFSSCVGHNAR